MRTGEAIIRLLEQYGVDKVFGIPGTHSIELYRGLQDSGIRHILPRHEQGGGFMADGYARMTGKPGVCFVITGPGVTNLLTPMGQAYSDSVPMLVISPVNDIVEHAANPEDGNPGYFNLGRLHEIGDQAAVSRPVTAFSKVATSLDDIPQLIADAFAVFHSHRPRPVHIHIPLSILRGEVTGSWTPVRPLPADPLDSILIDNIKSSLLNANAPVIVAGGGCSQFGELVVALAERVPCPVLTTVAGRGIIPGTHPLSVGAQISAPHVQQFLAKADFALVLGSELAEPDHWTETLSLPKEQIWINLDPELLENRAPDLGVVADAQAVVSSLNACMDRADGAQLKEAYQRCQPVRAAHRDGFTAIQATHWRVLTEVQKVLPADCCVCSDMTQLAYTAIDYLPREVPNSWFHPNGFGTLGYGLPAGIGVKLAHEQAPVLVIVGDAGLQYTVVEMGVAAEHNLNIVVLLWQNDALQQIADDMVENGISPNAVHQPNPDFIGLAHSFGWAANKVQGLYELGPALTEAFAADGPVLLELNAANV